MNIPGRSVLTSKNNKVGIADGSTQFAESAEIMIEPAIGVIVVVDTGDGTTARGVIVDDFGDLAGESVEIGTERVARARRWAVDIDGGHIVFVDDADLLELHPA